MQQGWHAQLIAAAAASALFSTPTTAQDFYAGKTIDFIVGHYVGGGYDIYARALARHYSRHIPGHPGIVVRNMPGAGSAKAGLHIANTAARDGTVIGAVTPGAIMAALLDGRNDTTFDPTRVAFIGTANHGTRICVTMKEAAVQTFADMLKTKTVIGGVAVNDATHDYAYMVKNVTGAQLSIVAGYNGTANIGLAMERREVDGSCGWDWASFKSQRARWLKENRVNVLAQIGQETDEDLTRRGAPPIWNFISNEDDRKAVELIISQQVFHRSYIAPPGVPAPRLEILRTAFLATMNDPQFLADADKTGIDIAPLDGGKIQELIARLAATPDAVVQRAKRAIRP
jgi:tripartite-type tricarboxylate transporter receptor subunit TctC